MTVMRLSHDRHETVTHDCRDHPIVHIVGSHIAGVYMYTYVYTVMYNDPPCSSSQFFLYAAIGCSLSAPGLG